MRTGHVDLSSLADDWYKNLHYELAEIDNNLLEQYYTLNDGTYATWKDQDRIYRCFDVPKSVTQCIEQLMPELGNDIGWAVHRTEPGTLVPIHGDHYQFLLKKNPHKVIDDIERYVIFPEDRQAGHIIEVDGQLLPDWRCGDWVSWRGLTPHTIANLGFAPRYSLVATVIR